MADVGGMDGGDDVNADASSFDNLSASSANARLVGLPPDEENKVTSAMKVIDNMVGPYINNIISTPILTTTSTPTESEKMAVNLNPMTMGVRLMIFNGLRSTSYWSG